MTKKSCRLSLQFLKYHLILSISFKSKIQNKICEMLLTLHPRFQATPKAASSRRAPEQNVKIFPAKHAQYVIWVFPRVSPFPLQFPLSVLKVPTKSFRRPLVKGLFRYQSKRVARNVYRKLTTTGMP